MKSFSEFNSHFCVALCVIYFCFSSVAGFGFRRFGAGTAALNSTCSTETRLSAIGCPCALVGIPCGPAYSICTAVASSSSGLPGICVNLGVTIVAPFQSTVSATACPGDNVQNLACGGTQPITCSLTFLGTTSNDAAGTPYSANQVFLSVVNPATGCCYVTPTQFAPSTDALECFTAAATDSTGNKTSKIICFNILKPASNLVCPLKISASTQTAFVFLCNNGAASVPVLQLSASGGTAPLTYSISLVSNSVSSGDGTSFSALLAVNSATGVVSTMFSPDVTDTQCYTGTVTDANKNQATTTFCVTLQGGDPGTCK